MNREFNILDRHENIHRHCLLEASAGTGKTFTVENLVVRFLLEKGPLEKSKLQDDKYSKKKYST